eukprot:g2694.t1
MPLSESHKKKIAAGVRAYHARAKSCLAKERSQPQNPQNPRRRVKPTLVATKAAVKPTRRIAPTAVGTAGQQTTKRLLHNLTEHVESLGGRDFAPSLAF